MSMQRLTPFCLALLLACEGAAPSRTDAQGVAARREANVQIAQSRRSAITDAVARVAPSVVTVQTETVFRTPVDPFAFFFGNRNQEGGTQTRSGIGSGFIVQANGVIVTNAHVVSGASNVSVAMRDGTTFPAKVVGIDDMNDLAVLKIDAKNLPTAPLGGSRDLLIGEWVIAIGNPYGFLLGNSEPSVTAGVISATGRNLVGQSEGQGVYVDMIQTDASINPGNSGGPLVNAAGEVIGVNSSIYTPTGGSVGLGFAIPIDRAKRVTEDLLAHGTVRRPWIGVKIALPQQNNRDALRGGASIQTVAPGSPAATAGLQAGDVIVQSRNRLVRNAYDWEAELLEMRVGEQAELHVRRGSRERTVQVRVADLPEVSAQKVSVLKEIELVTLTPAIRTERGIRAGQGAVVYKVSPRVTEELGVQTGDVIVQVNRAAVTDAQQAGRLLESLTGRGPIRMIIERGGFLYPIDFQIR
ncbi:MAG: trypsin-like peptidase domain-containing protein [Gemmatimonadota bacterium]|nr:trypsin-like peptidase domain-containing protein [Gemmatimonadota bacterium]